MRRGAPHEKSDLWGTSSGPEVLGGYAPCGSLLGVTHGDPPPRLFYRPGAVSDGTYHVKVESDGHFEGVVPSPWPGPAHGVEASENHGRFSPIRDRA